MDNLDGGGAWNSKLSMGHEIQHAYDHSMGEFRTSNYHILREKLEPQAVSFGNYLRQAYSLSPLRNGYAHFKGNFHQTPCHEKISDFTKLGHNADETAYGFSYTKTTTIFERYMKNGIIDLTTPAKIRTEITHHFIIVYRDKNKNNKVSYKIFNHAEAYNNASSKW